MRLVNRLLVLALALTFGLIPVQPAFSRGHSHHRQVPYYALHIFPLKRVDLHLHYAKHHLATLRQVKQEYDRVQYAVQLAYFNPANGDPVDLVIVNGKSQHDYLWRTHRPILVMPAKGEPYVLSKPTAKQVWHLMVPGIDAVAMDFEAHIRKLHCLRAMVTIRHHQLVAITTTATNQGCLAILDDLGIDRTQVVWCDSDTTQMRNGHDRTALVVTLPPQKVATAKESKPKAKPLDLFWSHAMKPGVLGLTWP